MILLPLSLFLFLSLPPLFEGSRTAKTRGEIPDFIGSKITEDPSLDPFSLLDEEAISRLWSHPTLSLSKISQLERFEYEIPVEVKLVGFDAANNMNQNLNPNPSNINPNTPPNTHTNTHTNIINLDLNTDSFSRFFHHFERRVPASTLKPQKDGSHDLPLSRYLVYHFSKAKKGLLDHLQEAIVDVHKEAKNSSSSSSSSLSSSSPLQVPSWVVDDIISSDFDQYSFVNTIYILNLDLAKKMKGQPYTYVDIDEDNTDNDNNNNNNNNPCFLSLKTGIGRGNRYIWVDIAAFRNYYGTSKGDGGVHNYTLPQIPDHSEKHPGDHRNEIIMDIASFVHETSTHLFARSLDHFPLFFAHNFNKKYQRDITLRFYVIHDHPVGAEERYGRFEPDSIISQLSSMQIAHRLMVEREDFSLFDDPFFATVFSNSLSFLTTTTSSPTGITTETKSYLDSDKLHHWINKWEKFSPLEKERRQERKEEKEDSVIPIYIFDLSYKSLLLLDQEHQSVSFPDMVIAIQTQPHVHPTNFYCGKSTRKILQPQNATRPILASLLQTIWGISPTHQFWESSENTIRENWLWSLSGTPFGYGNNDFSLSFYLIDSAHLNIIFDEILFLQNKVQTLFLPFRRRKREIHTALTPEDMNVVTQRWNALVSKFEKAKEFMSHHRYESAFSFLLNCHHDIEALDKYINKTKENVKSYFSCEKEIPSASTGFFWDWLGLIFGPFLSLILLVFLFFRLLRLANQNQKYKQD